MSSYKPAFILINWASGSLVGCGSEEECRTQLKKIIDGTSAARNDSFIIAEVKALSEMKRVET